jgi:hypothetical protein
MKVKAAFCATCFPKATGLARIIFQDVGDLLLGRMDVVTPLAIRAIASHKRETQCVGFLHLALRRVTVHAVLSAARAPIGTVENMCRRKEKRES